MLLKNCKGGKMAYNCKYHQHPPFLLNAGQRKDIAGKNSYSCPYPTAKH